MREGDTTRNGEGRRDGVALCLSDCNETVVALATPEGESGLAVIRMSGRNALTIIGELFRNRQFADGVESHRAYRGLFLGGKRSNEVDDVVVLPMLAPNSYTGEDVIEIFCHGGRVVPGAIIAACVASGAVPAGPGEFTRRAFINGRMDLEQAEAVADIVHAEQEMAAAAALQQMRGGLRNELLELEKPLLDLLARLEGSLEFSEDDDLNINTSDAAQIITTAITKLDDLLALSPVCRQMRHGVRVVLVGPPNVGKSSLVNALSGKDNVLVDEEAGTTRDVVPVSAMKSGMKYILYDTAGLRDGGGRIEQRGMERTVETLEKADVVLALMDNSNAELPPMAAGRISGKPGIKVKTKADLKDAKETMTGEFDVATSVVDGAGLDELWRLIEDRGRMSGAADAASRGVFLNARHQFRLQETRSCLVDSNGAALDEAAGEEVLATAIGGALLSLGEVSGRVYSEKLLAEVFNRFCVGK